MDLENLLLSINRGAREASAAPEQSTALSSQPWKPSGALAASDPFEENPPEGRSVVELLTVPRRAVELDLLSTERWHATKAAADAWPLGLLTTHVPASNVLHGDGGPESVGSVPAAVQAMLLAAGISPPPSVAQIMRVAEAGYFHEGSPCCGSSTTTNRTGSSVTLSRHGKAGQRGGRRTAQSLALHQMGFARESRAANPFGAAYHRRATRKRIAPTFVPVIIKHFLGIIAPQRYFAMAFLDDRIVEADIEAQLLTHSTESGATRAARMRRLRLTRAVSPAMHGDHCFAAIAVDAWPASKPVVARVAPEFPGVVVPGRTFLPSEFMKKHATGRQHDADAFWSGNINAKSRAKARAGGSANVGWRRRAGFSPAEDPLALQSKMLKMRCTELWATEVRVRQYGQQHGRGACVVRWLKLAPCHGASAGLWLYDVQPTTGKRLLRPIYGVHLDAEAASLKDADAVVHATHVAHETARAKAVELRRRFELKRLQVRRSFARAVCVLVPQYFALSTNERILTNVSPSGCPRMQHALALGSDGGRKADLIQWARARDFNRLQRERGALGPAHMTFESELDEVSSSMSPYAYLPMLIHLACHHTLTYQFHHSTTREVLHSLGINAVVWASEGETGKTRAVEQIDSAISATRCVRAPSVVAWNLPPSLRLPPFIHHLCARSTLTRLPPPCPANRSARTRRNDPPTVSQYSSAIPSERIPR